MYRFRDKLNNRIARLVMLSMLLIQSVAVWASVDMIPAIEMESVQTATQMSCHMQNDATDMEHQANSCCEDMQDCNANCFHCMSGASAAVAIHTGQIFTPPLLHVYNFSISPLPSGTDLSLIFSPPRLHV